MSVICVTLCFPKNFRTNQKTLKKNNMEIVQNQPSFLSLTKIKGGKRISDALQNNQKDLLEEMSMAFSIIHGGHFKQRRQIA